MNDRNPSGILVASEKAVVEIVPVIQDEVRIKARRERTLRPRPLRYEEGIREFRSDRFEEIVPDFDRRRLVLVVFDQRVCHIDAEAIRPSA